MQCRLENSSFYYRNQNVTIIEGTSARTASNMRPGGKLSDGAAEVWLFASSSSTYPFLGPHNFGGEFAAWVSSQPCDMQHIQSGRYTNTLFVCAKSVIGMSV